jgi:hypothetical protein
MKRFILSLFCTLAFIGTAHAITTFQMGTHAAESVPLPADEGGGGSAYIDGVISSAVAELNATQSASYDGSSQNFLNLVSTPADGSSQSDYDYYLGNSSSSDGDDPTFSGPAGTTGAKFTFDGTDYFISQNFTNQTAFRNAHRSDVSGTWFAVAFRTPDTFDNAFDSPFGSGCWNGGDDGVAIYNRLSEEMELWVCGGGSAVIAIDTGTGFYSTDTDTILIVSWDGTSTTNNVKYWMNTCTASTVSATFNTDTGQSNEASGTAIAATPNEGGIAGVQDSEFEFYIFAMGNEYIDDTKATDIFEYLETEKNIDFDGDATVGSCTN